MAIGIGSYVNWANSYAIQQVVASLVAPGPDPYWLLATCGEPTIQFQAPESTLWELLFTVYPAPWGPGDLVEVQDDGRFWFFPPGPGVRVGRGMVMFALSAGPGAVPCAWVQLEGGRIVLVRWESLTRVRQFGSPVP